MACPYVDMCAYRFTTSGKCLAWQRLVWASLGWWRIAFPGGHWYRQALPEIKEIVFHPVRSCKVAHRLHGRVKVPFCAYPKTRAIREFPKYSISFDAWWHTPPFGVANFAIPRSSRWRAYYSSSPFLTVCCLTQGSSPHLLVEHRLLCHDGGSYREV
jgi:hypothetical protein